MTSKQRFYTHLSSCESCEGEDKLEHFALCPLGRELLYEAVDELPEHWQRALARILREERIEKEANETAAYYADSEEI